MREIRGTRSGAPRIAGIAKIAVALSRRRYFDRASRPSRHPRTLRNLAVFTVSALPDRYPRLHARTAAIPANPAIPAALEHSNGKRAAKQAFERKRTEGRQRPSERRMEPSRAEMAFPHHGARAASQRACQREYPNEDGLTAAESGRHA